MDKLFRGFQVALDLNKLALAAAGILIMAFGWWLLAFSSRPAKAPSRRNGPVPMRPGQQRRGRAWNQFKQERDHWNLMREAAGILGDPRAGTSVPTDLIDSLDEYKAYQDAQKAYLASAAQFIRAKGADRRGGRGIECSEEGASRCRRRESRSRSEEANGSRQQPNKYATGELRQILQVTSFSLTFRYFRYFPLPTAGLIHQALLTVPVELICCNLNFLSTSPRGCMGTGD